MGWSDLGVLMLGLCCAAPVVRGQGYVNIAPGKTYNQSSTYSSRYRASYAADGNTATDPYFRSNYGYGHFWEVDLGRKYPVQSINVWGRGSINDYLTPFNITVDGQHCETVNSTRGTQASIRNISVTCSSLLYGQMVRLTRIEPTYLYLSEFEIHACTPGFSGDNCDQTCQTARCLDNTCHPDTGLCMECGGNFIGSTCSKCKAGYYRSGDICYPCSSLCAGSQCDPSSGSCIEAQGETTKQQAVYESDTDKLIVPVAGSIVGVGLLLTISLTAAVCWINRRREHSKFTDKEDNYYSTPDPVLMLSNTERGLPELPSSSPSSGNSEHTEPKTMQTDITDDDYTHPKTIHTGNTGNEYTQPKTIHTGNTGNTGNEYTHPKTIHTGNTGNDYTHPKTIHTGNTGNDYTHLKTIHTGNDYTHLKTIHTGNTDGDYTRPLAVQTINTDEKNTQINTVRTESPDRQGTQPKMSCTHDAGKQGTEDTDEDHIYSSMDTEETTF